MTPKIEFLNPSYREVEKGLKSFLNGPSWHQMPVAELHSRGYNFAQLLQQNRALVLEMFNTNTIDPGLQRVVALHEGLRAYAAVLAALDTFSTVHGSVPLEGTDEVEVPVYPLQAAHANSWNPATGYDFTLFANTQTDSRKVAVGGSGVDSGSNAAVGTAKDRKWIGLKFTSYEFRRQPFVKWAEHAIQAGSQLATDIFSDIVSRVITAANFPASKSLPAETFASTDIAELSETATGLRWPVAQRCLCLKHTYFTQIIPNGAFMSLLLSNDPAIRAQRQKVIGFDQIESVPDLDTYSPAGENLNGWISHRSAVAVATSPIAPTDEVRRVSTRYELIMNPATNIAFEYRRFGNAILDASAEVIECSYGAAPGLAEGLRRITSDN